MAVFFYAGKALSIRVYSLHVYTFCGYNFTFWAACGESLLELSQRFP